MLSSYCNLPHSEPLAPYIVELDSLFIKCHINNLAFLSYCRAMFRTSNIIEPTYIETSHISQLPIQTEATIVQVQDY